MLIESRISFISGQIAHVVDILTGLLPMKQSAEFMNGIKVVRSFPFYESATNTEMEKYCSEKYAMLLGG